MTLLSLLNNLISYKIANNTEGRKKYLYLFELVVVGGVFVLSVSLWASFVDPGHEIGRDYYMLGAINLLLWSLFYKFTVIVKVPRTQRYLQILFQFVRVSFLGFTTLILLRFIFGFSSVNLVFILFYSGLNLFVLFHIRMICYSIFKIYRAEGHDLHHVIVMADWYSEKFIEKIIEEKEWGFKISKIITNSNLIRKKFGSTLEVLPENTDIKKIIDTEVIDEVIYCRGVVDEGIIKEMSGICNEVGVIFRLQSNLSPLEEFQIQLKNYNESGKLPLVDRPGSSISLLFKQISDIYFSFTMLILLSPLFLLLGIFIKLDSRGPVFFIQERVGLRGRRFMLYKFRTMVPDAEKLLDTLYDKNEADGPVFKIKSDPRVTRLGRFLRKSGLDELPQLYNVLRGEMSLIGPRPPLPLEVAKYERAQLRRLSVRPGITCTWQVVPHRNTVKFESWMKLDLQYIDNWNLAKDFSLFLQTIRTIISGMRN